MNPTQQHDQAEWLRRLYVILQRFVRRRAFWVLNVSGWAVFCGLDVLTYSRGPDSDPNFYLLFYFNSAAGLATTLFLRRLYRGIRFQSGKVLILSLTVACATIAAANIWYMGKFIIARFVGLDFPLFVSQLAGYYEFSQYIRHMFLGTWIFATWSFFYFVIKFWIAWHRQREKAERLEVLAQQAQLKMLRYQLNPHFLFNSLNSIRAMVDGKNRALKNMITDLAGFLRYSLDGGNKETVPLSEEIGAVSRYLQIEKARFEDSLDVIIEVEPGTDDFRVPCFIIHPLVENALKYGMQTSEMPLSIIVKAERVDDGGLAVSVFNSGSWIEPSGPDDPRIDGTGTGLVNIRRRLETAYPGNHRFEVKTDDRGVSVNIVIGPIAAETES